MSTPTPIPEALAHFLDRVPPSARGAFFVTDHCRECALCTEIAPEHFRHDAASGHCYVYRQPTSPEAEATCRRAMQECPTQSIYDFGLRFSWKQHPPRRGDISRAA